MSHSTGAEFRVAKLHTRTAGSRVHDNSAGGGYHHRFRHEFKRQRDLTVAADHRSVGVSLRETPRLLRGTDSETFLSPHGAKPVFYVRSLQLVPERHVTYGQGKTNRPLGRLHLFDGAGAMSRAVLLVNLGTPRSPSVRNVRRYLNEFLMDPHVLNLPWPVRRLIVSGFILPFRPRRSAAAYASIWGDEGSAHGSPLLRHTEALGGALGERIEAPCAVAMRYGEPSIAGAVRRLAASGCAELLLVPLFPQHADSTRTTAIEAVRRHLPAHMKLEVLPPFYHREDYIGCQAGLIERHLPPDWDHLLLSYHGLPERHITQADPTGAHCLASPDCCERSSAAHATCYRHQCYATAQSLAARMGLDAERVTVSFQSRLGRLPWLTPYTDKVLAELPTRGVRRLAVYCPSFVADNLETLEEIGMQGRDIFQQAGGERLTLIPCLNASPDWVKALADWVR